jgi:hypothetical protein
LPLPGARNFADVTRDKVIEAAGVLGVPSAIAGRELSRFVDQTASETRGLIEAIEQENHRVPQAARVHLAGEMRLVRSIGAVVIGEMAGRLG